MKFVFFILLCLTGEYLHSLSDIEIKEKIESYTKEYLKQNNGAGLAIAVVKNSFEMEELYQKIFCFGYSQRVHKVPIRESTLFRLGSLSTTFTAALFAALLEEEKVAFEEKASKYLPKTFSLPKYHDQEFKVLDLLLNLSSLPNIPTIPMKLYQVSWVEVEHYFKKYQLSKLPGKKYERSELGYSLLAHIASRIERLPYERILSTRILEPLNLTHTYYSLSLSKMHLLATGYKGIVAVGDHFLDRDGSFFKPSRGLVSNIHDMKQWLLFFLKMENSSIQPCLKHLYQHVYVFPEDVLKKEIPGWRLGMLSHKRALPMYHEDGVYQGFSHCMAFIPDTKTGVVILSNAEYSVKHLAVSILELLNQ